MQIPNLQCRCRSHDFEVISRSVSSIGLNITVYMCLACGQINIAKKAPKRGSKPTAATAPSEKPAAGQSQALPYAPPGIDAGSDA